MYRTRKWLWIEKLARSEVCSSTMLFSLVLLVFIVLCVSDCIKPRKFPPGPTWIPVLGCLPAVQKIRKDLGYLHLAFEKLAEIHGPILGLRLGHQKIVVIMSHELVKKALLCEEFNGRPDGFFFRVRSFGARKGVIFTDGAEWALNRRVTLKHLRNFGFGQASMHDHLAFEARELVKNLRERCADGRPIAMHSAFDVTVLNAIWTMLAGYRFADDDAKIQNILPVLHKAFKITDSFGGLVSQMPFLRYIIPELCGYKDLMSVLKKLWSFIGSEVDEHETRMRADNHEANDLMDAYILQMMKSKNNPGAPAFDREDILVLCLDLFMAGAKTTTDALVITFAYLALNPKWLKILQEDLDNVVGDRDPTLEDAALLPRVEAFLAETHRTLVLTPLGVPHTAMKNVNFVGYEIPKDTIILVNYHSALNDETVWENPEAFCPERFLDENKQFKRNHELIHFGLGKRRCLGETLARSSLFLFFTHVVHNFDIKISEKHGPPCLDGIDGFVISPNPYHLILHPRR